MSAEDHEGMCSRNGKIVGISFNGDADDARPGSGHGCASAARGGANDDEGHRSASARRANAGDGHHGRARARVPWARGRAGAHAARSGAARRPGPLGRRRRATGQ